MYCETVISNRKGTAVLELILPGSDIGKQCNQQHPCMSVNLLYSVNLILLCALGVSLLFLIHYWKSHHLHTRCVKLCHRIADELSKEQQPELVMERIFQIVIEHTHSSLGMLSLVSEQDGALHVVRTHAISEGHADPGIPIDQIPGWKLLDNSIPDKPVIIEDRLKEALWTTAGIRLAARQNMLCIPVSGPGKTRGLLQLVSNPGEPFGKQQLTDLGGVGFYVGAAIHNAEIIEALRRQRDSAEVLYDIGLNISRFVNLENIIDYAVNQGNRLMESDLTWYLEYLDNEAVPLRIRKLVGETQGIFQVGEHIHLSGKVAELLKSLKVKEENACIVLENINTVDASERFCDTRVYEKFLNLGIHSALIVPVANDKGVKGLLCSFSREIGAYEQFEVRLMQRLANKVLIALNMVQLHADHRELAKVEEREHLSNELHDNMAQVINGLSLELHALTRIGTRLGAGNELLDRLERLGSLVRDAKANIRQAIFELRLPAEGYLWQNLDEFTHSFERWHELEISTDFPVDDVEQPLQRQREILRIIQEALWNIRKHSGTERAVIRGEHDKNTSMIRISVSDAGIGAGPETLEQGQGIATMKNRALHLGGHLTIEQQQDTGLQVSLEFPA